jgi:hypothetical protein
MSELDQGYRDIPGKQSVITLGHQTPGAHLECLHEFVKTLGKRGPLRILEVGSWVGESAIAMASAAPAESVVVCVDNFGGNSGDHLGALAASYGRDRLRKTFWQNTDGLPIRLVEMPSADAAEIDWRPFDLIFIDANHDYPMVRRDIQIWQRHLHRQGILSGHDYSPQFPGVVRAVDELGTPRVIAEATIWYFHREQLQGQPLRQRRVLNVFIGIPAYGGNGGVSSEHPDIREWHTQTVLAMKQDPRVGEITSQTFTDTPITMVRNQMVVEARRARADLLLMCDSDQAPNRHQAEPWFRPFWPAAFNEIYAHWETGPLVIGAPYGGPPPHENVYVFRFESYMNLGCQSPCRLEQFTRSEAELMTGITEVAALPTGLILFDMRIFSLVEPSGKSQQRVLCDLQQGLISVEQAEQQLVQGWFYYEWKDGYAAEKASTEDVVSTRNLALAATAVLGYNPLRCAWDSWIGHWKPWCVGRPVNIKVEDIAANFRQAVQDDRRRGEQILEIDLRSPPETVPCRAALP